MSEPGALQSQSVAHLPVGAFSIVMRIGDLSAAFSPLVLATHVTASRQGPFALPAWAYTFPLPAAAVAFIAAYQAGAGAFYAWAGGFTPGVASAIVIALGVRTARGFITGELLRPED